MSDFQQAFKGSFTSALRWHQLDALWHKVREDADGGWYLYFIGEIPPVAPADAAEVMRFIVDIDDLLRTEHEVDYCGIVYADDMDKPSFIKIYDPGNLGVSCGSSEHPPLPGWVLSKMPPVDLVAPPKASPWQFWGRLFAKSA